MNQSVDNAIGGYEDGHLVNVRDSALSPCPFCGGSNLRKGSSVADHGESTPYIECKDCDARVSDWYGNPIKKWNTRSPGIDMQDAFEQVCEALEEAPIVTFNDNMGTVREKLSHWHREHKFNALALATPFRKTGVLDDRP